MHPQDRPLGRDPAARNRRRFLAAGERLEGRSLLTSFYVNVASTSATQDGSAANPFKAIQAAIGKSVAGDTLLIAPGTYAEALTINHALTLSGPNAGIDPNTGTRNPEAVIVPPVNNPGAGRDVLVTGNNVRIDGLTIDGHNAGLATGTLLNGVSSNAASGVSNVDSAGKLAVISGLTVTNDVIRNFTGFGVIGDVNDYSGSTVYVSTGNVISHNLIDNLPVVSPVPGRGVSIEDNFYADVTDNVITRAGTGIQAIFSISPNTGSPPSQISRNTVHDYALGIYLWNLDTGTTAYTVASNQVTAEAGATATNVGIDLFRVLDGTGVNLTNNSVTGSRTGIKLDYDTSAAPVVVSGGTLSGNAVGVEVTNANPPGGGTAHSVQATLSGVTVVNSTTAGVAVTDTLSVSAAPVTLTLDGLTTVTGDPHGEVISGPYARLVETVKPVVAFTTTPPAQSSSGSASFAFTASDNLTSPSDLVVTSQLDGAAPAPASGTLNLTGLADGSHTLNVSATDQAGNVGTSSYQWTVSTSGATAPPSDPVLDPNSDSGVSNGDGITNVRTPTFLGSAAPGSTVTLYAGGTALGTIPVVPASGNYEFIVPTANALADGVYAITATDTSAGTTSAPSGPLSVTIDGTAPVIQTSFTASPNAAGWYHQAVTVNYTATDALAGLDSPASGSYTFSTSGAGQTTSFTVTDLAGNPATAVVGPVNIDLTAPVITVLAGPRYLGHAGGMVAVTVTGKISDPYSGVTSASFVVTDSQGILSPKGPVTVQPNGTYSFTVMLEASKRGRRTRSYKISVTALNAAGLSGTASTNVPVV